jgi:energy-coupling factor transporter ATP-binding protein EcfA2
MASAPTTAVRSITLRDVGPIQGPLTIPIPAEGGVVELLGRNGCGKTTTLEAVSALLANTGGIPVRDGAPNAQVAGLGATLTMGRSKRFKGALEVEHIEGRYNITDAIDPNIKDPVAADGKRIRTMLSLAGVTAGLDRFWSLLDTRETFEMHVALNVVGEDADLVATADAVKRSLEASARKLEADAKRAEENANEFTAAIQGVDLEAPCNSEALQAAFTSAVRHHQGLQSQVKAHRSAAASQAQAREALQAAASNEAGQSVEDARAELTQAQERLVEVKDAKIAAEQALEEAKRLVASATEAVKVASARVESAQRGVSQSLARATALQHLQTAVDQSVPECPSDDELRSAEQEVAAAQQAVEQGAIVRRALESAGKQQVFLARQKELLEQSGILRDAAAGTDDVLSEELAKLGIPVSVVHTDKGRRLLCQHRRGNVCFADLSDGERSLLIVKAFVSRIPDGGVMILAQRIWQDLDPIAKDEVFALCRAHGTTMLTARATADQTVTPQVYALTV